MGCPSEWGLATYGDGQSVTFKEQFPFNWLPQRVGPLRWITPNPTFLGFHSIGCPSEWGRRGVDRESLGFYVSIQLVAPASGASFIRLTSLLLSSLVNKDSA